MWTRQNKDFRHWTSRLLRWVILPNAALLVFYLVLLRFLQLRSVMDGVRVFNKRVLNPAMMTLAGRHYWYASVIRHVGRRSGKEYSTPVVAERVGEGFIIPLPYSEGTDWLKNVLAAGRATIESKGETYAVGEPEIIDAEAAFLVLLPRLRRAWRLFSIDHFLKVEQVTAVVTTEDGCPGRFAKAGNSAS